jgi:thymidine kinase
VSTLGELEDVVTARPPDLVIIDEAQLFEGLTGAVARLVGVADVVVCGLDLLSDLKPFGEVLELPADRTECLTALCSQCGASAAFTEKYKMSAGAGAIEIGGAETYRAVCRMHHPALWPLAL